VRLSTGADLELDGELLSVLEALYREVTLKRQLQLTFKDMMREIEGLVDQMGDKERRLYLVESLFLNSVTYENEMLDAYMRRLTASKKKGRGRAAGRTL
jgi:predicted DNA-binding helix-hairpin-helix protein